MRSQTLWLEVLKLRQPSLVSVYSLLTSLSCSNGNLFLQCFSYLSHLSPFFAFIYVYSCVCKQMCLHVYICLCGGHGLMSGIFLYCPPHLIFSLFLTRVVGHQDQKFLWFPVPCTELADKCLHVSFIHEHRSLCLHNEHLSY